MTATTPPTHCGQPEAPVPVQSSPAASYASVLSPCASTLSQLPPPSALDATTPLPTIAHGFGISLTHNFSCTSPPPILRQNHGSCSTCRHTQHCSYMASLPAACAQQ
eukprot:4125937-Ditylum_brightwellii.AAC.1